MEKSKLSVEEVLEYPQAVAYLEDLLAGLKSGTVVVSRGEESLTLTPAPLVSVEVEARVKKGRQRFSLQLEWEERAAERGMAIAGAPQDATPAETPAAATAPAASEAAATPGPDRTAKEEDKPAGKELETPEKSADKTAKNVKTPPAR